jgi:DNA topoisomerase-2
VRLEEIRDRKPLEPSPPMRVIDEDEAYAMGLFWADGSCGVYKWNYTHQRKDRPRAYDFERTSIAWSISNTNLDFLEKAKECMEKCYAYEFKVIEDRHNHKRCETHLDAYKLIVNGGVKTQDLVEWYRKLFYDEHDKKRLPMELLNANEEVRKRFFDGFYDGDGAKKMKCGSKRFDVDGKVGAMGMYYLAKSLGFGVSVNVRTDKPKVYILALTPKGGHQQANPITIKKIIDMGVTEDYVYDLETENHHFHAGVGQMIVHNTDGFHIRGLLFNVFQTLWPSLFKMDGFLTSMRTPIVKVTHPTHGTTSFYNLPDFHAWNAARTDGRWTIKYYKGLGTSTAIEAKEYFRSLNITEYKYDGQESEESMNLAFDKKRADDRKAWILGFDSRKTLDYTKPVTFSTFVNDELIHFSNRDVERNIPSLVDGMKESIRKIMFACFKKKLYSKEIRVAQLSGYVSEVAVYHHGEKSLQDAIVGMAQDFVGSNNINLLMPNGQFGTRIQGGDDAASPRYIHTMLSPLARLIFREEDNAVLTYKNDDDVSIEPTWYVPVIPMILVNGGLGIGTGFSTNVPCHNPSDVINMCATIIAMLDVAHGAEGADTNADNLESSYSIIDAAELEDIAPWYLGFVGKIELKLKKANTEETYVSRGCWAWKDDTTLEITELPVGVWTETYKEHLTKMIVDGSTLLKDFESHYTDKKACFTLKIFPGKREAVENVLCDVGANGFKLEASKSLGVSNMHLFDAENAIHKYADTVDIVKAWARVRLATYLKRKKHQLRTMEAEYRKVSAKVRFINDFIKGTVVIMNRKEDDVDAQLERLEYPRLGSVAAEAAVDAEAEVEVEGTVVSIAPSANFRYLTNLPIRQLTTEQKAKLESEAATLKEAIDALTNMPIHRIWRKELSELHVAWDAHRAAVEKSYSDAPDANASGAGKKRRAAPKAAAARKK